MLRPHRLFLCLLTFMVCITLSTYTHAQVSSLHWVDDSKFIDQKVMAGAEQRSGKENYDLAIQYSEMPPSADYHKNWAHGATARALLHKAADQNYPDAEAWLGLCYLRGDLGQKTDPDEAFRLLDMSAANGSARGMQTLGLANEIGFHTPQDYAKARQFYESASDAGDVQSMRALANMYKKGEGVPVSQEKSMEWMRKAAATGDNYAQTSVAQYDAKQQQIKADAQEEKRLASEPLPPAFAGTGSRPNHDAALAQIRGTMRFKNIKVTNFKYLNGMDNGQSYTVLASWHTTFLKSFDEINNQGQSELADQMSDSVTPMALDQQQQKRLTTEAAFGAAMMAPLLNGMMRKKFGDFKAGDTFEDEGAFEFVKTENGWILSRRIQ